MSDTTYNGWTNRATWIVGLWDWPEQIDVDDVARDSDAENRDELVKEVAEHLKIMVTEYVEESLPKLEGFLGDFVVVPLDKVNWREIAEHMVDEDWVPENDEEDAA